MRRRLLGGGVLLALLIGACGGNVASPVATPTGTSTPNATPTATVMPSPAVAARTAAEAFEDLSRGTGWSFDGAVSGTVVTSWSGNDVYVNSATGSVQVVAEDGHLLLAAPDASGIRVFEETRIDGERTVRGPDGVWRAEEPIGATRDLLAALASPGAVETVGREEVEGTELTVLRLAPADVGTIGGIRADQANPTANLEVLVRDDGVPVILRVAFGSLGTGPSVEKLEISVTSFGDGSDILPPVAWREHDSSRGYSLLVPAECSAIEGDENWEQFDCEWCYLRVWTAAAPGVTPEDWVDGSVASWSEINEGRPAYLEKVLLVGKGSSAEPGWIAIYRYEEDGTPVVMYDGVFMHDGTGYDVIVVGPAEYDSIIGSWFLQIAATITFD